MGSFAAAPPFHIAQAERGIAFDLTGEPKCFNSSADTDIVRRGWESRRRESESARRQWSIDG